MRQILIKKGLPVLVSSLLLLGLMTPLRTFGYETPNTGDPAEASTLETGTKAPVISEPVATANDYLQPGFAGVLPADATSVGETFIVNDIKYKVLTNDAGSKTVAVVANSYTGASYTIPSVVEFQSTTFYVTEIGDNAFENCTTLTSVILPGSISRIGDSAFKNTQITAITLPASLNSLSNFAFSSCTSLKTVRFKGGPPHTLGSGIFDGTLGCTIIVPRGSLPIFQLTFDVTNNDNVYIRDEAFPAPGTGLASDHVKQISMTLNWTGTTDRGITAASDMKYYIYRSDSNNITTVANCEANGTLINSGGTAGITTFDVTGLTASTTYWFNVVAENIDGNKSAYTSFTVITSDKDALSGAVNINVTQAGNAEKIDAGDILVAEVDGVYPTVAQSALSYQWYRGDSPISGATTGNYTVDSLSVDSAGTEISVKVTGAVDIYTGTLQSDPVVVDAVSLEGSISITGGTTPGSTLTLDTSSLRPNGATYTMQWYRNNEIITGQTGQSYILEKADLGKIISVVISGTENYSGTLSAQKTIPTAVPELPGNLQGVAKNREAILSWSAPFDGGSTITGYEVSKDGGASWKNIGMVTSYTVTGLTNNNSITLQVRAVNSTGNGSAASVTVTPAPTFIQRTLTDQATGITVSGLMDDTAILSVQSISIPAAGNSTAWDSVRKLETERKGHLYLLDISLTGDYSGEMTVSFPVDPSYNGKKLDVCHINGGTLETYSPTVENGVATFKVNSFSPFAVYAQTQSDSGGGTATVTPVTPTTTPTIPKTGDSSNLGLWLVLMSMALLASGLATWQLVKRRKNTFQTGK